MRFTLLTRRSSQVLLGAALIICANPQRGVAQNNVIRPTVTLHASDLAPLNEWAVAPTRVATRLPSMVVDRAPRDHRAWRIFIGAVIGGVAGAVIGNAYARAHVPPCLPTPAGFCQRSGTDYSTAYKAIGISLGAALGAWAGAAAHNAAHSTR